METDYIGIDYGGGQTNIDHDTGIRYGVVNQGEIMQAWADESEGDYGECSCPKCGNTDLVDYDTDIHDAWDFADYDCAEYVCTDCKYCFGSETAYTEDPISFDYNSDGYQATQGGDDTDIFILKSPYYTLCQFCSPCAPGAGYIMHTVKVDGIRAYCFGHDWFEEQETGRWIDCDYCNGTGLKRKADIPGYNEERYIANGGILFDQNRVKCYRCQENWDKGLQGRIKEKKSIAPYPVYSVKTGEIVEP